MNKPIGNYGLDGPPVIRNLSIMGIIFILCSIVFDSIMKTTYSFLSSVVLICGIMIGIIFITSSMLMIWSSKVGKIHLREEVIDAMGLNGNESVVDVGCGRGLLLVAAARRLASGKAIGVDIWQTRDQSGNCPAITIANAKMEGVADRVEVKTGDMGELPFMDKTIDIIISSLAIHNIPDKIGRAKAIKEIVRVLKPGGRIALLDYRCTGEYAQTLRESDWSEVKISKLVYKMFPPVRIVSGIKPN